MPVVPFSPKQREATREVSAADEPWMLMAAAQMDQQKRLVEETEESSDGSTNGG